MLFGIERIPPLFRLYGVRFTLENADILSRNLERHFIEHDVLEELAPLNRKKFLERGLSLLGQTAASIWEWPFQLVDPPKPLSPT